ncbi:MAG: hypothetical protein JSS02_02250 [Planctomycetes bacterium]|nr:hypothetical protein [Planctomycetota bacterium]
MGLDMTAFVMEIEETFGISIPDKDYQDLDTVGALSDYVARQYRVAEPDDVWQTVRRITSEHFNIPPAEIKPTSRWGEDLQIY